MKPSKVKRKAQGGLVDSAPEQAIADTVRNPAAARMLDMDLANFALMSQQMQPPRRMAGGGRPPLRSLDEVPSDEYLKAEIARINAAPTVRANSADETANYARYVAERASQPIEMPARPDYTPGFSVLEKPTYGSEVPGTTPTVDQQRYELTMRGQQNAANKQYRAQQGDALAGMDPTGTLAVTDAARTMGLGMLALPVHAGRTAFHYLQHGNMKDAPTGMDYEELMSPRTAEGAELVEEIGTAGSRIMGAERGFGMNPSLWTYTPPTLAQMRAGLKLGAERAAPVLGKVDKFVREGYDSGLIPQPGMSIKDVTQNDKKLRLYHGSPDENLTEVNDKGIFGGIFGSPNKQSAESHGDYLHYADIPENKILSHYALNYEIPYEEVNKALLKERPDLRNNPELHEKVWDIVIGDKGQDVHSLSNDSLMEIFNTDDYAEAAFNAQKLRGKISKNIGYQAVELEDEHGTSYLINPGIKLNKNSEPKPEKILAPANEIGFYSPTEAAGLNLKRQSGNGQAFLNDILKGENVKSDEISGMGLDTFLKGKTNVTADEVQDYIAQNKLGLGESVYGTAKKQLSKDEWAKQTYPDLYERMQKASDAGDTQAVNFYYETLNREWNAGMGSRTEKTTKFGGYQLPGGENYREIVLTLPDPKDAMMDQVRALGIAKNKDSITINDILQRGGSDELAEGWQNASKNTYKSSHFDEPNVLSHLRVSDRVTDGKKTLLVDEVQSDWHQAGRDARTDTIEELIEGGMPKDEAQKAVPKDFGYQLPPEVTAPMDSEYRALVHKNADAVNQGLTPNPQDVQRAQNLERKLTQSDASKIPNAPYKEDWYQLTLRRAIKEAVDGGYDRVALPTGKAVADRFQLSKTFSEIHYSGTNLKAYDLNGNTLIEETGITPLQLKKFIGKEGAKKLLEQPKQGTLRSLVGQELEFGGEGMKKYYDEIYPTYLKKFGKKYDANVGSTTVDAGGTPEPLHYMEITPAMRKEFSTGIHMKRGGKVHFASNLDAMRQELTQRR